MERTYECGHCKYVGPCYQAPMFYGESAGPVPLCKRCGESDKMIRVVVEKTCMLRKNCPIPYEQNDYNCSPMNCDRWIGL